MVRTILNSNGKTVVLGVLNEQLGRDMKQHFRTAAQAGANPELLAVLYSGAVINCAQWWLTRGSRMTKEQVVDQFALLVQRL